MLHLFCLQCDGIVMQKRAVIKIVEKYAGSFMSLKESLYPFKVSYLTCLSVRKNERITSAK